MRIGDRTIKRLLGAERAVLILTRSDCRPCREYERDIASLMRLGALREVAIGRLVLDRPGAAHLQQAYPWMATLQVLPFTVLFRNGRRVEDFAALQATYLLRRVRFALFDTPADDWPGSEE